MLEKICKSQHKRVGPVVGIPCFELHIEIARDVARREELCLKTKYTIRNKLTKDCF